MNMGERIKQLRIRHNMTQEELGKAVGIQKSAVQKWEKGYTENLKRSVIETLSKIFEVSPSYVMALEDKSTSVTTRKIPLLGTIAAGEPIYAEEYCTVFIEVDASFDVDYCLCVRGDSMVDARIYDGDKVFIRKQPTVENGEIAAVIIDEDATLKRFYKTDTGVILKADNPAYEPSFYSAKDFKLVRVLGKAIFFQGVVK